jgi:copper chaperone CopZ
MEEKTVHIPAISCSHCVMAIKNELIDITGVESVEGDPKSKMVTVRWQSPATWAAITDTLKEINYPPED